MNIKKIDHQSQRDLLILFKNLIPINILAIIFRVTPATIIKYLPPHEKEDIKDFSETGNKKRVHLLKIYAWLLADEKECINTIGTPLILAAKEPLYEYFHLKEWEQYLKGVVGYKKITEKNFFGNDVPEGFRKLIEELFPTTVSKMSTKELLEDALKLMHAQVIAFPTEEAINKPEKGLEVYIEKYIFSNEKTYKYFDQKFLLHLTTVILNNKVSPREQECIEAHFGISNTTLQDFSEKYDLTLERIRNIKQRGMLRIYRTYVKHYNVFRKTIAEYIEVIDKLKKLEEGEIKMKDNLKALALFINDTCKDLNRMDIAQIIREIVPEEELFQRVKLLKLLEEPLEDLDLSVRAFSCLRVAKISTLKELVQYDASELTEYHNFGIKSLVEIEEALQKKGLYFGMKL